MHWVYKLLIAFVVVLGVPFYWLLIDNRAADVPEHHFDLTELRRLSGTFPGPRPERILVQEVAWRRVPGALMVAGGGLKRNNVVVQSFLLTTPGRKDIVIDSGIAAADARRRGYEQHRAEKQHLLEQTMRDASLILFTHEHLDHMGGFLRMADADDVARRALITPEQMAARKSAFSLPWPPGLRAKITPFRYGAMAAVAPGVVLIKTPGHTPGSQMIYVRLAGGREYLFAGDTASMARNWQFGRARSRLLSDILSPEDRAQTLGWLRAIAEIKRQAPALVVVPGHDFEHITDPEQHSGIDYEFPERGAPDPRGNRR